MFQHYALRFYPALFVGTDTEESNRLIEVWPYHIVYHKFGTLNLWAPVVKRAKEKVRHKTSPLGVADGARTRDTQDHNLVLYQLNYSHHHCLQAVRTMLTQKPRIVKTAGSMG